MEEVDPYSREVGERIRLFVFDELQILPVDRVEILEVVQIICRLYPQSDGWREIPEMQLPVDLSTPAVVGNNAERFRDEPQRQPNGSFLPDA